MAYNVVTRNLQKILQKLLTTVLQVGVRFAYRRGVSAATAAAVAGVFQLPSQREPPQTTVRERCERHKQTMSFQTRTQRTLRNVCVKKRTAFHRVKIYNKS